MLIPLSLAGSPPLLVCAEAVVYGDANAKPIAIVVSLLSIMKICWFVAAKL